MNKNIEQPEQAVKALSALAHHGRLSLIRALIQAGPEGVNAGALATQAGVGATTASAQLLVLANADLVSSERVGRQVIYRASYESLSELLSYLMYDCCCGASVICDPITNRRRS